MPVPSTKTNEFICDQADDPFDEQSQRNPTDLNTLLMMFNLLFNSSRQRNINGSSPPENATYSIVEINPTDGSRPFFVIIENRPHPEGYFMMHESNSSSEMIDDSNQSTESNSNSHLVQ